MGGYPRIVVSISHAGAVEGVAKRAFGAHTHIVAAAGAGEPTLLDVHFSIISFFPNSPETFQISRQYSGILLGAHTQIVSAAGAGGRTYIYLFYEKKFTL